MGVDRKCIHMMQTEQADTVRYLGSNPLYGAQLRVRFRIGHGAQCIQRARLCKKCAPAAQSIPRGSRGQGRAAFPAAPPPVQRAWGKAPPLHGAQVP